MEDLADMMARVPGNRDAVYEHFNLTSDRCITLDGGRRGGLRRSQERACWGMRQPRLAPAFVCTC